MKLQLDEL